MEAVFLKLVNMSLTAGWLVLAVIAVRVVLKKAPRWMLCALWGLVAFRLVCPISVESALSLIPSSEPLPREILYAAEPEINSGVPAIDQIVNPVLSESLTADGLTSANPTQIWSFLLSRVWLVGMIAMLLYVLGSFLLLKRRMATATLLRENIRQSELADSPFVLGIFRPTIYLPYAIHEPDMAHVIAHEQAHIRRRDHWWKPLGFLLLSVYWFNPLLWLAYALLCRDMEAACDEKVIADMGKDDRRAYSTALLNCSVHRRRIAACPLAFGEVGVKDRVRSVMSYKKPAFRIIAAAVGASIVVAACFLTNPPKLQLDFSGNAIVSASCFDVRDAADEQAGKELDRAQLDELTARLEALSATKRSGRFAGLAPGYQISGRLADGAAILISGYGLDHTGNVDIQWLGRRYVVTDEEFQAYLSRVCSGGDTAAAEGGGAQPGSSAGAHGPLPGDGPGEDHRLAETYVDIDSLPPLGFDAEDRYVFADRVLVLEDTIDNELERVVFEQYYCISSARFDRLMALVGENTSLQIATENEEKNFNEGIYMSQYVLHSLTTLPAATIREASAYVKDDISAKIAEYDLTSCGVVGVDLSWSHNELAAGMGPQLGDGRYMRYWLLGKTASDPAYRLYELYWDTL